MGFMLPRVTPLDEKPTAVRQTTPGGKWFTIECDNGDLIHVLVMDLKEGVYAPLCRRLWVYIESQGSASPLSFTEAHPLQEYLDLVSPFIPEPHSYRVSFKGGGIVAIIREPNGQWRAVCDNLVSVGWTPEKALGALLLSGQLANAGIDISAEY